MAFFLDGSNVPLIVNAIDYYSYGKILREYDNGAGDRYLTTGHERDQKTGLDYRGARYYDSDVARFLSLDPLASKYPAWSTYNYVMGNPVAFVDPDGKKPLPVLNILSPSWASQKGFYVHQKANDLGTSNLFAKGIIDLKTTISLSKQLDRATEYADGEKFQTPEFSYRHAMRNGKESIEEAKDKADAFVRERYKWARHEFDQRNKEQAFFILGVALHPIQDATSPVHGGFQAWTGEESDLDEVNHVVQEYSYPGINSNLQKVTNDFLELFFSKKDLPDTNIFEYIQIDQHNEELKGTD